jgi:hypothetical protein
MLKTFSDSAKKHPGATLAIVGAASAGIGALVMRFIDTRGKGDPGNKTFSNPPAAGLFGNRHPAHVHG